MCHWGRTFVIVIRNDCDVIVGCDVSEVQDMVECHLKDMILKHFDPKKADSIFTAAEQVTLDSK